MYTFCLVFNLKTEITSIERPDVPMNLECRSVSSRSVKLSWKRPFDGNSPMLSYIVQYQPTKFIHTHLSLLNSDDHWNSPNIMNITLPNISIGKRYVYPCIFCRFKSAQCSTIQQNATSANRVAKWGRHIPWESFLARSLSHWRVRASVTIHWDECKYQYLLINSGCTAFIFRQRIVEISCCSGNA